MVEGINSTKLLPTASDPIRKKTISQQFLVLLLSFFLSAIVCLFITGIFTLVTGFAPIAKDSSPEIVQRPRALKIPPSASEQEHAEQACQACLDEFFMHWECYNELPPVLEFLARFHQVRSRDLIIENIACSDVKMCLERISHPVECFSTSDFMSRHGLPAVHAEFYSNFTKQKIRDCPYPKLTLSSLIREVPFEDVAVEHPELAKKKEEERKADLANEVFVVEALSSSEEEELTEDERCKGCLREYFGFWTKMVKLPAFPVFQFLYKSWQIEDSWKAKMPRSYLRTNPNMRKTAAASLRLCLDDRDIPSEVCIAPSSLQTLFKLDTSVAGKYSDFLNKTLNRMMANDEQ